MTTIDVTLPAWLDLDQAVSPELQATIPAIRAGLLDLIAAVQRFDDEHGNNLQVIRQLVGDAFVDAYELCPDVNEALGLAEIRRLADTIAWYGLQMFGNGDTVIEPVPVGDHAQLLAEQASMIEALKGDPDVGRVREMTPGRFRRYQETLRSATEALGVGS